MVAKNTKATQKHLSDGYNSEKYFKKNKVQVED